MHYKRWRRWGDPEMKREPNTVEAILEKRNVTPEGCWEWTGGRNPNGYGKTTLHNRTTVVHRLSYEHFVGPIPNGFHVCHHCDNPPCFNPEHLFVGTPKENDDDMRAKGREYRRWSQDDILRMSALSALGFTQTQIGELFGASQTYVSVLLRRQHMHVRAC
jgi:hypothetical protein